MNNIKKLFIDKEGNRESVLFVISFIMILMSLSLKFATTNIEVIMKYFNTMHGTVKISLLFFIMIMSISKVVYTNASDKSDKVSKITRYIFDGGIILITIIIMLLLFGFQFFLLINNQAANEMINFILNNQVFLLTISVLLGFYLVSIIFSMIENV